MSRRLDELLTLPRRAAALPEHVLRRAAELEAASRARTPPDLDLVRVRRDIARCLGVDHVPRVTAPVWTVSSEVAGDGFTIEVGVFEAIPGLVVPTHVYRPATGGPHPAVVHLPGHWMENSRLEPDVQRFNIRLARAGVVVLCPDPIGQGERRIGWHQHGQLAPLLVGFTSLAVMVIEAMTALDILAGRPDVDGARLGMTGASGGGFVSTFVTALDERVAAAAICCILNTHVGQLRDAAFGTGWDGWIDLCNQVPGLAAAASMGLVVGAAAPRTLAAVHAVDDAPFPIEGARAVVGEAAGVYAAAGAADRVSLVEVSGGHGLHPAMRAAATAALASALGASYAPTEAPAALLEHPYDITHERARARPELAQTHVRTRPRLPGESLRANVDTNRVLVDIARARAVELRKDRSPDRRDIERALGIDTAPGEVGANVRNHLTLDVGAAQRIEITSGDVTLDAVLLLPGHLEDGPAGVVVVLDEGGKTVALESAGVAMARERGLAVLAVDLSGTGESASSEFELATACWMLDGDLLALRVRDLRVAVEWLSVRYSTGQQIDKSRIAVWGFEAFGLVALLAAALEPQIAGVASGPFVMSLEELLVLDSRTTPMAYPFGALQVYDLVDLARLAGERGASVTIGGAASTSARIAASLLDGLDAT